MQGGQLYLGIYTLRKGLFFSHVKKDLAHVFVNT